MDDQRVSAEQSSTPAGDAHRLRNGIIWAGALLVLLLAIGLAVPDLRKVLDRVANAEPGWLALGLGLELASCLGYVAILRLILRRGPAREVRRLAWAEMAFGAVVPVGGAGGLAVGAWAMRAWNLPWRRIADRSAAIFLLTSGVNAAVLVLGGLAFAIGIGAGPRASAYGLIPAGVGIVAIAFFLMMPLVERRLPAEPHRGRLAVIVARTSEWVRATLEIMREPNWRLLGSLTYLLCDIAVLWACLRAVGAHPPVMAVVVAYQIGYLSNLIPIPGGVGVLEGGLLGALLLYGLPAAPTAAAVVIYHAIALWIPVLGGTIGFARLRRVVAAGPPAVAAASVQPREHTAVASKVTRRREDLAA